MIRLQASLPRPVDICSIIPCRVSTTSANGSSASWTNAALNAAAAAMQVAVATDAEGIKAGMAGLGVDCESCQKVYRQPE